MVALAALAPPQGPREPIAYFTGGGVGDNTPAVLLFPEAIIRNVMLITKFRLAVRPLVNYVQCSPP